LIKAASLRSGHKKPFAMDTEDILNILAVYDRYEIRYVMKQNSRLQN